MYTDKTTDELFEIVEDKFLSSDPVFYTKCNFELLMELIRRLKDRLDEVNPEDID